MLRLLMDENIHLAISAGLCARRPDLDLKTAQQVGMTATDDPIILDWAAQNDRVTVSLDRKTLVDFAWERVRQGLVMPGVLILRPVLTIGQAIDDLELYATVEDPAGLKDRVIYLP